MREFRTVSYHTEYSCSGDYDRKMASSACFASAFRDVDTRKKSSINYKIKLYTNAEISRNIGRSNFCPLSKKDLKNHIYLLKGIIPFEVQITEYKEEKDPYYEVDLKLNDLPGIYHKFILTWIRYAYEFPYNMFLVEANKLRKEIPFRFDSVANLFNLVGSCVGLGGGHTVGWGESIGFLQRKELTAKLKKVGRLNSIYKTTNDRLRISTLVQHKNKELRYTDMEFWNNDELYQDRLKTYLQKYKHIKANPKLAK